VVDGEAHGAAGTDVQTRHGRQQACKPATKAAPKAARLVMQAAKQGPSFAEKDKAATSPTAVEASTGDGDKARQQKDDLPTPNDPLQFELIRCHQAISNQPASDPMTLEASLASSEHMGVCGLGSSTPLDHSGFILPECGGQQHATSGDETAFEKTEYSDGTTAKPQMRPAYAEEGCAERIAVEPQMGPEPPRGTPSPRGHEPRNAQTREMATPQHSRGAPGMAACEDSLTTHRATTRNERSPRQGTGHLCTTTPTPGEEARRLARFKEKVQVQRDPPLVRSPPRQPARKQQAAALPLRSRRIAAQNLGHIPAAKRGEVLLMRKMGMAPPAGPPSAAQRQSFDDLFAGNISTDDAEALDELFPATRARSSAAARMPQTAAA
jgi:hypothetical protein